MEVSAYFSMFPKLQIYIILNIPRYKHYALCKINHCIRVSGRQDNTDFSTVSWVSLVVSINVNIEVTFSESGEFCCLWHCSLKFWKHSLQCPIQFEAVTVFFKFSESFGLQKGAQQPYSPSVPWYKYTLSPALVAYIAPFLYIQVIDMTKPCLWSWKCSVCC